MPTNDAFPSTFRTWIEGHLEAGDEGRAEINQHLMSVYHAPLQAYLRKLPFRFLGPPADVVAGFFADRLGRPEFLRDWPASGRRLRRWLCTALRFYLREATRRRLRDPHVSFDPDGVTARDREPDRLCDRAFAASITRAALAATRDELTARGLEAHYAVFVEHHVHGERYATSKVPEATTKERARVMARTAEKEFRRALRDQLVLDGCSIERVDAEIELLVETLS